MTTKELLEKYYKGFARKSGWEAFIADDFKFIGGDMMDTKPVVGKEAYIAIVKGFFQLYKDMRPKEMIIEGELAFVRANYDYAFPNGKKLSGDIAEVWKVKKGKLAELTIFFDTAAFSALTKPD